MKYNNLEKFIAVSDLLSISEFEYSNIYKNFRRLNEDLKYRDYLNYDFDEFGKSMKLDNEINIALMNKDLLDLDDNLLYISMNKQRKEKIIDSLNPIMKSFYIQMIDDYKKLNEENNKRKSK